MDYFLQSLGVLLLLILAFAILLAYATEYLCHRKVSLRDKINTSLLIVLIIVAIVFVWIFNEKEFRFERNASMSNFVMQKGSISFP